MIAVLADDFTGAAEVGAVGHRYGLVTEVRTTFGAPAGADLMVIDTHSRSSSRAEARRRVLEEVLRLKEHGVKWVYKKVDSVLRGHVVAELEQMLNPLAKGRVLLVPANPSLDQIIHKGHYTIAGLPLHETKFAQDPEYPAVTSHVLELLGDTEGVAVAYRERVDGFPDSGIIVSSGVSKSDLAALAAHVDECTLAAGAAEFFAAFLEVKLHLKERTESAREFRRKPKKTLFVLGSNSEHSRIMIAQARSRGVPIVSMPAALYTSSSPLDDQVIGWADATLESLQRHKQVIVAIDKVLPVLPPRVPVDTLPHHMAHLTKLVVDAVYDDGIHLFVEGGTTASTVVRRLGWARLNVQQELRSGIVTLSIPGEEDTCITVKPGSYPWPRAVWQWFE